MRPFPDDVLCYSHANIYYLCRSGEGRETKRDHLDAENIILIVCDANMMERQSEETFIRMRWRVLVEGKSISNTREQMFTLKLSLSLQSSTRGTRKASTSGNKILIFKSPTCCLLHLTLSLAGWLAMCVSLPSDKHEAAIFTFSDFLLGNQNINSIMQQARSVCTNRDLSGRHITSWICRISAAEGML